MRSFITDNVAGKSGEKDCLYDETVLKSLIEKGYLLQKVVSLQMQLLIQMKQKFKNIQSYLKHKITVKKRILQKLVERTIHYVFADGTKASEDHHDQVSFHVC